MSDLTPDDRLSDPLSSLGTMRPSTDPSTDVLGAVPVGPSDPGPIQPLIRTGDGADPSTGASESSTTDPEDSGGDSVLDLMGVLEGERDSYLDDLQRVSAEFANFRKQAEKRSVEVAAVARGALAERLLPVLDACDLAIEHGDDGVVQIRKFAGQRPRASRAGGPGSGGPAVRPDPA